MVSTRSYGLGDKVFFKMLSADQEPLTYPLLDYIVIRGMTDTFTRGQREYLFAITSMENGCSYCYKQHIELANTQGITEEQKLEIENATGTEIETIKTFTEFVNSLVKYNEEQLWK